MQCGRFLKQTQAMAEVGCNRCHEVERSCATCHSNHGTERRLPRDPAVCSKCHMGPDHPQWEMWQTSRHGMLHATLGKGRGATCQDCHLPDGGHDVSRGLTMSATGQLHAKARFVREREHMLKVCARCHARAFAARELARADQVREQSVALVRQAEQVIREVARRGKLDPMPGRRPPHPQRGHALVLDGQMLYEDTSHLERLFFKMKLFDLAKTVKGAFHQNPAYAHWYGNAELKLTLVDIRAEAARLLARPAAAAPATGGSGAALTPAETLEEALRELKERAERGELSPDAYRAAKAQLLRRFVGR